MVAFLLFCSDDSYLDVVSTLRKYDATILTMDEWIVVATRSDDDLVLLRIALDGVIVSENCIAFDPDVNPNIDSICARHGIFNVEIENLLMLRVACKTKEDAEAIIHWTRTRSETTESAL